MTALNPDRAQSDEQGDLNAPNSPLRFLTCGSVDDGKSTLIGRLLFDVQAVKSDTLAALDRASATYSTTGGRDLALLVDGLQAEREQGITIDVAYRYFATERRSFIVADTPGHEQYTRNMATGASNCDLAVLLVDATKELQRQTFRHLVIVTMLGIRHVVLAVNKMDQVGFDQAPFEKLTSDFRQQCARLGDVTVIAVPLSALDGDNVCVRSLRMPWYEGPTLLSHLETVDVERPRRQIGMRFPVQWVCRPYANFRGYAGTIIGESVTVGDEVVAATSGIRTQVSQLWSAGRSVASANAGEAVMIALADEIDLSRGEILSSTQGPAVAADQFAADLIWFGDQPMRPGRGYRLQVGPQSSTVQIGPIKYMLDIETLRQMPCREVRKNEIARCNLALSRPLVLERYDECRELGGFIVIDRATNDTVGAGLIRHALHRASNIRWQDLKVNKGQRAALKGQRPCCLWFTGLSGAGKSTIANLVEARLASSHYHTYLLDGDNVRHGLNRDLGFTESDRVENIRRLTEVARLMVDAGLITIVAAISPFRIDRDSARQRFETGEFIEVFVDTPLDICEHRDTKGLYRKARAGEIGNFTGISSPYEAPEAPEMILAAALKPAEVLTEEIIQDLLRRRIIS